MVNDYNLENTPEALSLFSGNYMSSPLIATLQSNITLIVQVALDQHVMASVGSICPTNHCYSTVQHYPDGSTGWGSVRSGPRADT